MAPAAVIIVPAVAGASTAACRARPSTPTSRIVRRPVAHSVSFRTRNVPLRRSAERAAVHRSRMAVFATSATQPTDESRAAGIIDGKQIAADIRAELKIEVDQIEAATGKVPGLAVVLVGSRKDSETYVRSKKKACEEVGIASFGTDLPEDISEAELLQVVADYNADPAVHGILVQLPLPPHIDETKILDAISIEKDVDGFHPMNIGMLAMRGRSPRFVSCTPKGCIELLERSGVKIAGKLAVVIGRSNIVGIPAAMLLQERDATVIMAHSRTENPEALVKQADIVVAACGRAEMVRGDWIKDGAVVIDVGINAVDDPTKKRGYRLVGDVNYAEASKHASLITPVPGGVGPMTIAMLMSNAVAGAKVALGC